MPRPKRKNPNDLPTASVIVAMMIARDQSPNRRPGFVGGFAMAVGFFTRIPVTTTTQAEWLLVEAAWAFPLVGAGIGAITALVFLIAQLVGLGDWPSALLAVLSGLLLTGALHEDGLADSADGIFGGGDREQRLAIMRDSRHGTFAVLALVMSIALRAAALAQIGEAVLAGLALVAAHAVSRALLPAAMSTLPSARGDGLGTDAGKPRPASVIAATLIALAIAAAALGPVHGIVALGMAAASIAAASIIARRRIGGYTGDVLGAFQQIGEIVILLAAVGLR